MRKARLFLFATIILMALMAVPSYAAGSGTIDAQVVNGTPGGGAVDGLEVSLLSFQGTNQVSTSKAIADAQGNVHFEGLETGSDWAYLLQATYAGVAYSQGPLAFATDQTALQAELTVYETTNDGSNVSVERAHLLMALSGDQLQITEVHIYNNAGDRTYVGSEQMDGRNVADRFVLPKAATNLAFQDGSLGGRFVATKEGFADTEPRWPGSTSVVFAYDLPCTGGSCSFTRQFVTPVANLNVLLPDGNVQLSGDRLSFEGNLDAQGSTYLNYAAHSLAANEKVTFTLAPKASTTTAAPRSSSAITVVVILGGGLAVVLAVAYPFLRRRGQHTTP